MAEKKTVVFQGYSRRLDVFVSDELETLSRSLVQQLIKDGHVTVNSPFPQPGSYLPGQWACPGILQECGPYEGRLPPEGCSHRGYDGNVMLHAVFNETCFRVK